MVAKLNPKQIDEVLEHQVLGRLGCHSRGKTYIVPVNYAYNSGYIYGCSKKGMKIRIMRQNPAVCFQVDELKDIANWRSVIVWGKFEELKKKKERNKALQILMNHPSSLISSVLTHDSPYWPFSIDEAGSIKGIFYRILIKEKTGRCEQNKHAPLVTPSY